MRILSIEQKAGQVPDGLSAITMQKLNRIVLLAGVNGSGKSRLLARVLSGAHHNNRRKVQGIGMDVEPGEIEDPVLIVSKDLKLEDPAGMPPRALISNASIAKNPGANHLAKTTLAYIQNVQTQWWNATHQHSQEPEATRNEKIQSYESLCLLIQTILGTPLQRDLDSNSTLFFDKPIAQAGLSDGQRSLLQWCTTLHAQEVKLADLILILDEPENHLHAEALVSTVNRIVDVNTNGQIWIATHSVPLIAALYKRHISDLSVYFMHSGEISFALERPEQILNSLMGGEENIEALREFIDLPEVFATNRFATQCLLSPEVVADDQQNDPQVKIVNTVAVTEPTADDQTATKLLDFGCGKGRLLSSLLAIHDSDLQQRIDYVGYDQSENNRSICEQVIEKAFGSTTGRWFCKRQQFFHDHPGGQFDWVVLCNVLHEISPTEWLKTFIDSSIINQSLSETGRLLLIEDYLMPKGEYAHPFGFIVLDTEALQKLFGSGSGNDKIQMYDAREGRIKGHVVPKHLLANVTSETVRDSLRFAQQNAEERVNELRGASTQDFKSGRAHGFWIQQFANTTLALKN